MKKYFSIFTIVAMIFATSSGFTSCGDDDDDFYNKYKSKEKEVPTLVGTWGEDGMIWKITKDTFRINKSSDLFNNIPIPYVYKNDVIYLIYNGKEWAYAKVDKLTLDSLHTHLVPGAVEGAKYYPSYIKKQTI